MKKLLALLLVLMLCVGLIFANGAKESSSGSSKASGTSSKKVVLKVASVSAPGSVIIQSLNQFKADVESKSNGSIEIQIFPSSQLGNQNETSEGVSMGTIEMCVNASAAFEAFDNQFSIYGIPFLFENDDHVYKFYCSDISKKMLDNFEKTNNMKCICFFNEGFRTVWTVSPIKTLEDFKGYKLRVPDVPMYIEMFSALGCNAIPLSMGDIYMGIQTGTVDGLEFPISAVIQNRLAELTKFQTITNHTGSMQFMFINNDVFKGLSTEQQNILLSCAKDAEKLGLKLLAESKQELLKQAEELNVKTIELSSAELSKIQKKMEPVVQKYTKDIFAPGMVEEVRKLAK